MTHLTPKQKLQEEPDFFRVQSNIDVEFSKDLLSPQDIEGIQKRIFDYLGKYHFTTEVDALRTGGAHIYNSISPNNEFLISASQGIVTKTIISTKKVEKIPLTISGGTGCIQTMKDNEHALHCDHTGCVRKFKYKGDLTITVLLEPKLSNIKRARFTHDEKYLISTAENSWALRVHSLETRQLKVSKSDAHNDEIMCYKSREVKKCYSMQLMTKWSKHGILRLSICSIHSRMSTLELQSVCSLLQMIKLSTQDAQMVHVVSWIMRRKRKFTLS